MLHTDLSIPLCSWRAALWGCAWAINLQFAFTPSLGAQTKQRQAGTALHQKANAIASKAQLEHFGVVVVTESDGKSYGLVASFPTDKYELVWPYLQKHHIGCFGSIDLGECGLYVPIRDFYKARKLLLKIKPQLQKGLKSSQLKRVSI